MSGVKLTVDEIITVINRTSLPTILVEGQDDVAALYRWIEDKILDVNANVMECYGRNNLIKIYERKSEIKKNKKVVFLADRDMWLYTRVPPEYKSIIFTQGYSIENDLIEGSLNLIMKLFNEEDSPKLDRIYNEIIPWYSNEIINYMNNKEYKLNYSIQHLLDMKSLKLKDEFRLENSHEEYKQILSRITENTELYLRGKTLLEIFSYILTSPSRTARYGQSNIMDLMMRFDICENPNLMKMINNIENSFAERLAVV